jgi:CarD family transcriptional regulator
VASATSGPEGSAGGPDRRPDREPGKKPESFVEGDFVVYPSHGAGCVTGVEEKTVLGEVRRYYVINIPISQLTLSIPADGKSGLRACSDEEELSEALGILRDGATEMPSNWNQRLKHNQEKIRSGEIRQIAEVIRNLRVHGSEGGLSTGERDMLMRARRILASELALVRGIEIGEAEKVLDDAVRDGVAGREGDRE